MAQPAVAASSIHRDGGSNVCLVTSLLPQVVTTTPAATAVDLKGYDGAVVLFHVGNSADTLSGSVYMTPSITECDTSGGSYTAVPSTGYRVDVGSMDVIDAPAEDSKVIQVTLLGARKQFIKPVMTLTGTHTTGTPIGISVLKTHPRFAPATA